MRVTVPAAPSTLTQPVTPEPTPRQVAIGTGTYCYRYLVELGPVASDRTDHAAWSSIR